jgi:predicted anti-sigma-YlaC factor YlaD
MLTCKQATRIMSEKLDRELSRAEKLSLGFHLTICKGCRNYDKQMGIIHQACQHVSGRAGGKAGADD